MLTRLRVAIRCRRSGDLPNRWLHGHDATASGQEHVKAHAKVDERRRPRVHQGLVAVGSPSRERPWFLEAPQPVVPAAPAPGRPSCRRPLRNRDLGWQGRATGFRPARRQPASASTVARSRGPARRPRSTTAHQLDPTEATGSERRAGSEHKRSCGATACWPPRLGALVGAFVIGLVFAGYAIGHRSSGSAKSARSRSTGSSLDIQQILKSVQPSVVSILTGHTTTFYDSAGSGVVISKDGLILTNNHVIEGAKQITVKFNDGSQATATLVGSSPEQRHRIDQGGSERDRAGQAGLVGVAAGRRRRRRHRQRIEPRRRAERHPRHRVGEGPHPQHVERERSTT